MLLDGKNFLITGVLTPQSIAFAALLSAPRLAGALLEEVGRASIVSDARMASRHAGLGSQVRYWDEATDAVLDVQLVDPRSADRLGGDIPVLSPVGIALIGMGVGQTGPIPDRRGGAHPAGWGGSGPARTSGR